MLFMILLGLTFAPTSAASTPVRSFSAQQQAFVVPAFPADEPRKECPDIGPRIADERGLGSRARRLDELPAGRLEYAVFRQIDGCAIPAVVRENIGRTLKPESANRR